MELRKAVYEDWPLLLNWRNDYTTRMNCQDPDLVEDEKHKKWLQSKLAEPGFEIYIALRDEIAIGTIRSEQGGDNGLSKISWTIGPEYRNKGLGLEMVRLYLSKLNKEIRIEVKKEDIYSQKIADHLNFVYNKEQDGILHYFKIIK